VTQSKVELLWSRRELTTKVGNNLDLLSCMWLHISGGLNCCQEFRRRVVYRLIEVRIEHVKDIIDIIDVNLRTKELGYN